MKKLIFYIGAILGVFFSDLYFSGFDPEALFTAYLWMGYGIFLHYYITRFV